MIEMVRPPTQRATARHIAACAEVSLKERNQMWKSLCMLTILAVLVVSRCATSNNATDGSLKWKDIGEGEGYNKEGEWKHGPLSDFAYIGRDPRLIVIDDSIAVSTLQDRVLPSHLKHIARTDFSAFWVAVIYQGFKCRPGYSIKVGDVGFRENTVTIYAQFHEPANLDECFGLPDTSPYYALRIKKPAGLEENFAFTLDVNGQSIPQMCAISGEHVSWERLVNDPEAEGQYEGRSARLAIATDREAVASIQSELLPIHRELVSAVDYSRHFVIVAYHGQRSTTGYSVEVIHVKRHENTIRICAQFHKPRLGQPVGGAVTSPYYILQVEKTEELEGEFTFVLMKEDEEVARQPEIIP